MRVKGKIEISRVTTLRSSNSQWLVQCCSDKDTGGQLCEENDVLRMQRVAKGLSEKLRLCGINKIKHFQSLQTKYIFELSASDILRKM